MGPILFSYHEESLVSSNLNSKLFRFYSVRPNGHTHCGIIIIKIYEGYLQNKNNYFATHSYANFRIDAFKHTLNKWPSFPHLCISTYNAIRCIFKTFEFSRQKNAPCRLLRATVRSRQNILACACLFPFCISAPVSAEDHAIYLILKRKDISRCFFFAANAPSILCRVGGTLLDSCLAVLKKILCIHWNFVVTF